MLLLAPQNPVQLPPARRPGSIRRTSTVDMTFPEGWGGTLDLAGRARDLLTREDGTTAVAAADEMHVVLGPDRVIRTIETAPARPGVVRLVGARCGGGFRAALDEAVPEDRAAGTPLALLLDDIAGASLIGGFAWSRHHPRGELGAVEGAGPTAPRVALPRRSMEGVCSGFRPGSSALGPNGRPNIQSVAAVPSLVDPADPLGWHVLDELPAVAMRRARRVDVWRAGGAIHVEAMFRDHTKEPDGSFAAVHEYRLDAVADADHGVLTSVVAEPRVLPYPECPGAAPNVAWLVGTPLSELRAKVLEVLRGPDCCTHLNDALRALAEVPVLAAHLH